MWFNLFMLSAPYILFYHFATIRAVYVVKRTFTVSLNKADYPAWLSATRR